MSMQKIILTFFLAVLCSFFTFGQQKLYTKSKKAIKLYKKAEQSFRYYKYAETADLLKKALKADPKFIEAYLLYAQLYQENKKTEKAKECYYKIIEIDAEYFPMVYYYLGNTELAGGNYAKAKKAFEALKEQNVSGKSKKKATQKLRQCNFAIEEMRHPVPFAPVNLGDKINTASQEYAPALTIDGQGLFFTRLVPTPVGAPNMEKYNEDFFLSRKAGDKWMEAINLGKPINTVFNEGAQSLSANGQTIVYTSCLCQNGMQKCCDLYMAKFVGKNWTRPQNMGTPVNTTAWESQPTISADGQTIYFVSNRKGGLGGKDIWVTNKQDDGTWGTPVNLGDSINTPFDDISPFIHPDGKTLYFASNGIVGLGGFDLYLSRKQSNGKWTTPQNLGYPINTHKDEKSLILNAAGDYAFFASERDEGFGGLDLYGFDLYPEARPTKVIYVEGIIYDKETRKPLQAKFQLINLRTKERVFSAESNPKNGNFLLCLPLNENYAFHAAKPGYLFFSENFSLKNIRLDENFKLNIPLKPIKKGENIVLKNVFFDTDKYLLKQESNVELLKLVDFLKKNPTIKIELGGHTDKQGTAQHNKTLSMNRAKAVYLFLIEHQIAPERLTYKGYGFTKPIDTNETQSGRARNRRTEYKIISH